MYMYVLDYTIIYYTIISYDVMPYKITTFPASFRQHSYNSYCSYHSYIIPIIAIIVPLLAGLSVFAQSVSGKHMMQGPSEARP